MWLREEILQTPTIIYLYEDSAQGSTFEGQAAECLDLGNCYPIFTKHLPCRNCLAYFGDRDFEKLTALIDSCFEKIPKGRHYRIDPNILSAEWSELKERAPRVLEYIKLKLEELLCSKWARKSE